MDRQSIILMILLSIVITFDVIATYLVFRNELAIKKQIKFQLMLIWLVPFFGGLLAILVNREQKDIEKPVKKVGNDSSTMPY